MRHDAGSRPEAISPAPLAQAPRASDGRLRDDGRVVVLRALPGLGDVLCAVPALRALKRRRPNAAIAVVAHPSAEAHWRRFGAYVDDIVTFPGWPGLPDRRPDIAAIPDFLARMQGRGFDLAIQLHGDGSTVNQVLALFGAARTAGYFRLGEYCPDARTFLPWRDGTSEIRRGLRLMTALGFPDDDESLEFPMSRTNGSAILKEVYPLSGAAAESHPLAVIHPGASTPKRCWPAQRFAKVADGLSSMGFRIAITGDQHDRHTSAAVLAAMEAPALDLTGRTTLDDLAAILRRAALLVCNDTGVSHLAAALRVPSVVVFTDSDMARWAPLDRQLHRPVSGPVQHVLFQVRRMARRALGDAAA